MAEINCLIVSNNAVAHVLKEIHDPMIDGSTPSFAQYVNAAGVARRVIDSVLGGSTVEKEDHSDYEGALEHWRQLK